MSERNEKKEICLFYVNELLKTLKLPVKPFKNFIKLEKCLTSVIVTLYECINQTTLKDIDRKGSIKNKNEEVLANVLISSEVLKLTKGEVLIGLTEKKVDFILVILTKFRDQLKELSLVLDKVDKIDDYSERELSQLNENELLSFEEKRYLQDCGLVLESNKLRRISEIERFQSALEKRIKIRNRSKTKQMKKTFSSISNQQRLKDLKEHEVFVTDQLKLWIEDTQKENLSEKQMEKLIFNLQKIKEEINSA